MHHAYDLSTDSVRLALVLGVVFSLLIYERWRITGGSVIVAGYLAVYLDRPAFVATTLAVAMATYWIVQKGIAQRVFLYGRRRLLVMVLVGLVLQLSTGAVGYEAHRAAPILLGLYGIGFVLPGLIAQDMDRQGIRLTILAVSLTTGLTFLALRGLLALKTILPPIGLRPSLLPAPIHFAYPAHLIVPAVVLSIVLSALLFERTGVRSGGFVTAGYAALFVLAPWHLAFVVGVGALVFLFVSRVLQPATLVVGRTRFGMVVLTAVVFTWLLETGVTRLPTGAFIPFAGFSLISPMIAALIANDSERQGFPLTLAGAATCTAVVFFAMTALVQWRILK